jgi:signal transduction histidine kinase
MVWSGVAVCFYIGRIELENAVYPAVVSLLAGLVSMSVWCLGLCHIRALAVLHLIDTALWGSAVVLLGFLCTGNSAEYVFVGFYGMMTYRWASECPWTVLGFLAVFASPVVLFLFFSNEWFVAIFIIGCMVLYQHVSRTTKAMQAASSKLADRDQTLVEIENAWKEKRQAEKTVAMLIHEVGNMIGPLVGNLEFLRDACKDDDALLGAVNDSLEIYHETTHAFHSFLAIFRGQDVSLEHFNLSALEKFEFDKISVHVSHHWVVASSQWPSIKCVGRLDCLKGALRNLVKNAIEAGATYIKIYHETRYRVTLDATEREVAIFVEDNGHGIPKEVEDNLFTQFLTVGKANGNGLGMWLSRRLLESMHGRLELSWTRRGGDSGTCFKIILIPAKDK